MSDDKEKGGEAKKDVWSFEFDIPQDQALKATATATFYGLVATSWTDLVAGIPEDPCQ